MKILFLDIDGVLNSMEFFARIEPTKRLDAVDPKALRRMLRVLNATGAVCVLSSTWRLVPELVTRLQDMGLPIVGKTPQLDSEPRCNEIAAWIGSNMNGQIDQFAIIDDDRDAGYIHPDRFVHTHAKYGFYGKHEKKLLELLA